MKAGIYYSDRFNAVSVTGAREMTGKDFGFGLDGFITVHRGKLRGILNGIDYDVWNPETDSAIFTNYSDEKPEMKKKTKNRCRNCSVLKRRIQCFSGSYPDWKA
jgi:Starch synthase catalytic domain.